MIDLTPYKECSAHKQWIFIANASQIESAKVYKPCCWFKSSIEAKTPNDFYSQLAECDIETNCKGCIDMEKSGPWSLRTSFKDSIRSDKVLVVTASFDNLCNLKCITCIPENSTRIAAEKLQIEGKDIKWFNKVIKSPAPEKIDFIKQLLAERDFEEFRFEVLGGEPLINPMVLEFIDWLAEQPYAKNTVIVITTNGTTKCENIQKYLNKFSMVGIQLSIDGTDNVFEYIRSGANYQSTKETIDYFYQYYTNASNMTFGFNYTLSWMNSSNFKEFINWISTDYPKLSDLLVTKLIGPNYYSVDILSSDNKRQICEYVINGINPNITNKTILRGIEIFKQHMDYSVPKDFDTRKFDIAIDTLNNIDILRNTTYQNAFNQIIEFIKHD